MQEYTLSHPNTPCHCISCPIRSHLPTQVRRPCLRSKVRNYTPLLKAWERHWLFLKRKCLIHQHSPNSINSYCTTACTSEKLIGNGLLGKYGKGDMVLFVSQQLEEVPLCTLMLPFCFQCPLGCLIMSHLLTGGHGTFLTELRMFHNGNWSLPLGELLSAFQDVSHFISPWMVPQQPSSVFLLYSCSILCVPWSWHLLHSHYLCCFINPWD